MSVERQPGIGEWYLTATGDRFEVVAFDAQDQTVELQYFDGTIEEIDLDTWYELPIEPTAAPEDWSGSYDIERDDYGVDLDQAASAPHVNPLDQIDQLDQMDQFNQPDTNQ